MDAGAKATGTYSCRPVKSSVCTQVRFRDLYIKNNHTLQPKERPQKWSLSSELKVLINVRVLHLIRVEYGNFQPVVEYVQVPGLLPYLQQTLQQS